MRVSERACFMVLVVFETCSKFKNVSRYIENYYSKVLSTSYVSMLGIFYLHSLQVVSFLY